MSRTILLVEDNEDDVLLTLRAMKKNGIQNEIVVMRDGGEALDYLFDAGSALPWIILLDLKLPRIDGLETLSFLRAHERTKLVPVIILSSSSEKQDVIQSYSLGANSYLRKPGDFRTFERLVHNIHVYWQANETASRAAKAPPSDI
jgi:two-component system, response regulator